MLGHRAPQGSCQQQETECLPTSYKPGFTDQLLSLTQNTTKPSENPHHSEVNHCYQLAGCFLPQYCLLEGMKLGGKAISLHSPPQSQSFHPPQSSHCYEFGLNQMHIFTFYSLSIHELYVHWFMFCLQNFHQGFTINILLQFAFFPHHTLFSAFL